MGCTYYTRLHVRSIQTVKHPYPFVRTAGYPDGSAAAVETVWVIPTIGEHERNEPLQARVRDTPTIGAALAYSPTADLTSRTILRRESSDATTTLVLPPQIASNISIPRNRSAFDGAGSFLRRF